MGADFCRRVIDYQVNVLNVTDVLLPGRFTNVRNENWLAMHRLFAETASEMSLDRPVYSTVSLGPDVIQDRPSLDAVLNEVTSYPVNGVYLLYRPPNDEYLTANVAFLLGLLVTGLSLSLADKEVIIGYANQQDLILAGAGVQTISSGNYRNVRSFNPDIFEAESDDQRRRSTWYYDGRSLCEFRPTMLGVAYQYFNLRGQFGPSTQHATRLLEADNPALVPWGERESFCHFLTALRDQWLSFEVVPRARRAEAMRQFLNACRTQFDLFAERQFPLGDRSAEEPLGTYLMATETFLALERSRIAML